VTALGAVVTAFILVVATACGSGDGEGLVLARASTTSTSTPPPPSTPATNPALPRATSTSAPSSPRATLAPRTTVAPKPATTTTPPPPASGRRRPVRWTDYAVAADGRTLTFRYYSGIEPCSVFDSITAQESPSQVVVTIHERNDAGPDTACIMIAKEKFASVRLAAPLGGRRVVDGAS
jgi:hypothetical protein